MSPMFDGHDPRWKKGKQLMKRFFDVPNNQAMSDAEFMECQQFVIGTMEGSDWATGNLTDAIAFRGMVQLSYQGSCELGLNMPWRILKSKFDRDHHWPVFEQRNDKCYIAFFVAGLRKTEWVEFTQSLFARLREPESVA